jgi:Fibronectin type III domain
MDLDLSRRIGLVALLALLACAVPAQATLLPPDPTQGSPSPPTGLTATPGDGQVVLDWDDNNAVWSDFTHYAVWRLTALDVPSALLIASPTESQYTDTGLTNGTTYYYTVFAYDVYGFVASSPVVSATPAAPGPSREDYRNGAQFCKAARDFLGDSAFRERYGGGASAYGKCVSGK